MKEDFYSEKDLTMIASCIAIECMKGTNEDQLEDKLLKLDVLSKVVELNPKIKEVLVQYMIKSFIGAFYWRLYRRYI